MLVAALQCKVDIGPRDSWTRLENFDVPRQKGGIDCGVYSLLYARFGMANKPLNFSQQDISSYRRLFCQELTAAIDSQSCELWQQLSISIQPSNGANGNNRQLIVAPDFELLNPCIKQHLLKIIVVEMRMTLLLLFVKKNWERYTKFLIFTGLYLRLTKKDNK
ncbi:unnamed protein product [Meloidogyne enterolobii]|uniref:Uncharacterized protein n=1 Tax=Meloidogyne enterolobii TaxID=390850 RepID=A0ACB1AHG1_MELEN